MQAHWLQQTSAFAWLVHNPLHRRWRSGQPMDAPIRCYTQNVRPKRRRPFEAEYRLLAELGLRRN